MILNNIAQKKYLTTEIDYNSIINYIMINLKKIKLYTKFNTFDDTIKFIQFIKKNYDY